MPRSQLLAVLTVALLWGPAAPAQETASICQAVAEAIPKATFASTRADGPVRLAQGADGEVEITFVGHASYLIRSPAGVTAATDYGGAGPVVPRIATMNKAHSMHNTPSPDPAIEHVLRGWNPEGGPASHNVTVEDVYVRNVPSDIRSYGGGGMEKDGNSIFVFETAGLCIGHLGHLHEKLTDDQFAAIGRLDVVMVPVDGSWTMSQEGMAAMVKRFQSRVVLPMHNFRGRMDRFLAELPDFAVERRASDTYTVSLRTLPRRPTVVLLDGV